MEHVMKIKETVEKDLNKILKDKEIFVQASQKTGMQKAHLFILGAIVFLVLFVSLFGGDFFANILGWAYPTYASFKAIESRGGLQGAADAVKNATVNKNGGSDDKRWLTYWVVFAFMNVFETFFSSTSKSR